MTLTEDAKEDFRKSLAVKTYERDDLGGHEKDKVTRNTTTLASLDKKTNVVGGISSPKAKGSFKK